MPDIDEELIARAIRWCAEAGRQASPEQVRMALGPLSWDQLLAVRARLADPPPVRPLGPWALADLGRGAIPGVAAERERAGQYRPEEREASAPRTLPDGEPTTRARKRRSARRGAAAPVIHRARDRVVTAPGGAPERPPLLESLLESEGRAVLERLVRKHGARRAAIVRALADQCRRGDGTAPDGADLDRLLQAHGLSRSFERREHDELLHALRASGGVMAAAAARIGASTEEFRTSLERLGATRDAEEIREVHRTDVRRRATLSERVRLLLADSDRLADLGLLGEIEDDLRARLPEHLRAPAGAPPRAARLRGRPARDGDDPDPRHGAEGARRPAGAAPAHAGSGAAASAARRRGCTTAPGRRLRSSRGGGGPGDHPGWPSRRQR